jgi:hypothetical protein
MCMAWHGKHKLVFNGPSGGDFDGKDLRIVRHLGIRRLVFALYTWNSSGLNGLRG